MNNETSNQSSATAKANAEPLTSAAFVQSMLILGALGVAAYKLLDAALRLL